MHKFLRVENELCGPLWEGGGDYEYRSLKTDTTDYFVANCVYLNGLNRVINNRGFISTKLLSRGYKCKSCSFFSITVYFFRIPIAKLLIMVAY